MHVSAAQRLMPSPPARVDRRNTKSSPRELNSSIRFCRSCTSVLPSIRWKSQPLTPEKQGGGGSQTKPAPIPSKQDILYASSSFIIFAYLDSPDGGGTAQSMVEKLRFRGVGERGARRFFLNLGNPCIPPTPLQLTCPIPRHDSFRRLIKSNQFKFQVHDMVKISIRSDHVPSSHPIRSLRL